MRHLTDHVVAGDSANHQLDVSVLDEPGQGGACHAYRIGPFDTSTNPGEDYLAKVLPGADSTLLSILFQNGPIKEVGVNGVTHEAILAILIDRMRSFQSGPYACDDNHNAMDHLQSALAFLQKRTVARIARGVEGTHEK